MTLSLGGDRSRLLDGGDAGVMRRYSGAVVTAIAVQRQQVQMATWCQLLVKGVSNLLTSTVLLRRLPPGCTTGAALNAASKQLTTQNGR